ncbi:Uncharacterised protein [Serratia grimesii]|nr:Uncharacterised protein [Serratia grimesii]
MIHQRGKQYETQNEENEENDKLSINKEKATHRQPVMLLMRGFHSLAYFYQ